MKQNVKNRNYCATVVEITKLVELPNCSNVQYAIIMGNSVVVSKQVKVGDIGLFFPVETQLSKEYLSANNLYRKPELNSNPEEKGYFEENGRIRCVKFKQNKSEGLFMPIQSILFTLPKVKEYDATNLIGLPINLGDEFDEIEGIEICKKYIPKTTRTPGAPGNKKNREKKYESKLVDGQFRFHNDTSVLYKNLHRFTPESLISITYKLHGTSGISSYVLCKRPATKLNQFIVWFWNYIICGIIPDKYQFILDETDYDYLYASRKVIKNKELNSNAQHFYDVDIWGLAHERVKEHLQKGYTFYYEIVGYLPNGSGIQGQFDYGCEPGQFEIYIYRITSTNVDGKVIEFSAKQVQDFCKKNGLKAVPELYYGKARNIAPEAAERFHDEEWRPYFLENVKKIYNEKDCFMCKNKLPEEGVVIRIEGLDLEAYKCKSTRFLEYETKELDKGTSNIEDEN